MHFALELKSSSIYSPGQVDTGSLYCSLGNTLLDSFHSSCGQGCMTYIPNQLNSCIRTSVIQVAFVGAYARASVYLKDRCFTTEGRAKSTWIDDYVRILGNSKSWVLQKASQKAWLLCKKAPTGTSPLVYLTPVVLHN